MRRSGPLLLLQASALESADRWPEAKTRACTRRSRSRRDQPLILNFLGYSKLERSEDLDLAEALIRKASALAPDDASITNSLGWALFKRGRMDEAIATLQQAAMGDPAQAEIHEHLGDALYSRRAAGSRPALPGRRRGDRRKTIPDPCREDRRRADQRQRRPVEPTAERGYAKLNLALHVRCRSADVTTDRTLYAFCDDGDELKAAPS